MKLMNSNKNKLNNNKNKVNSKKKTDFFRANAKHNPVFRKIKVIIFSRMNNK